jgi:hypothetical protein
MEAGMQTAAITVLARSVGVVAAVSDDEESPTLALTWLASGGVRARALMWSCATPRVLAEAWGADEDTARAALTVRLAEIVRERLRGAA